MLSLFGKVDESRGVATSIMQPITGIRALVICPDLATLQEIGRETNTLGSKSADAALSHVVVELKTEQEKLREQVLNLE